LTVLGPVGVRVAGNAPVKRPAYMGELLTYLTTRPHGATSDELCTAFELDGRRARNDINLLRTWLGKAPGSGILFVPHAKYGPEGQRRGVPIYETVGVLSDLDLFRRLRLRGESGGGDGIASLIAALRLVTGPPFQQLRTAGWGWLFEGDRIDQYVTCAIADIAHAVVTASLASGDLRTAREAVDIAVTAAPYEEFTRLDRVAVLRAEGHLEAADRIIRDDICNRSDDGDAPLPPSVRSEEVIEAKRWNPRRKVV